MTKDKDILLDHNYDGIMELDNDMPPWWVYLFYITIAFAVLYFGYFHILGIGDSQKVEYLKQINPDYTAAESSTTGYPFQSPYYSEKIDMTPRLRKQLAQFMGSEITFSDLISEAKRKASPEDLKKLNQLFPSGDNIISEYSDQNILEEATKSWQPLTDETSLTSGKDIWLKNCAVCHLPDGGGSIGPNMTDQYWIHGGAMDDIIHTINNGVPAKGMISWKNTLSPTAVHQVGSYILTLQGTKPEKAKPPQGELYSP